MKMSESFNELVGALSKFQAKVTAPPKNKTVTVTQKSGGQYSFSYSELPTILDHIREPFAENGLAWTSTVEYPANGGAMLRTRVFHSSGQWIETEYRLPNTQDQKQFAGEITYGRRYSLSSLLGIASDQDADELPQETKGRPAQQGQGPKAAAPAPLVLKKIGAPQVHAVVKLLETKGWNFSEAKRVLKERWGVGQAADLTFPQYNEVLVYFSTAQVARINNAAPVESPAAKSPDPEPDADPESFHNATGGPVL